MCDCKKDESDLRKIARLKKILDATEAEANRNSSNEYYRNACYGLAWDAFWDIANSIKMKVQYSNPDGSYEDDMRAFYNAYSGASWLAKALEEEDDNTNNEVDDGE